MLEVGEVRRAGREVTESIVKGDGGDTGAARRKSKLALQD